MFLLVRSWYCGMHSSATRYDSDVVKGGKSEGPNTLPHAPQAVGPREETQRKLLTPPRPPPVLEAEFCLGH